MTILVPNCACRVATINRTKVVPSNPLKADPSRTLTLRRAFETELHKRLMRVARKVRQLVEVEDAFGLRKQTTKNKERSDEREMRLSTEGGNTPELETTDRGSRRICREQKPRTPVNSRQDGDVDRLRQTTQAARRQGDAPDGEDRIADEGDGGDEEGHGQIVLHNRQTGIDARVVSNTRWAFRSDPRKVVAFRKWLTTQIEADILVAQTSLEDAYWTSFVEEGYKKGAGRAFNDVRKPALASGKEQLSFFNGTREEFLRQSFGRPVAINKVKLLAGRVFTDLKGVTDEMSKRMTQTLTQGLTEGLNPRDMARRMIKDGIGFTKRKGIQSRALTIARTEIIRAHAEGQLDALEDLGVTEVGVMVEWSTAGDDRVCPLCQPLEGTVMKISEARGIIPRHPNCRCAHIPANVGESKKGQDRGKAAVRKNIDDSIKAEIPKQSKRTLAQQKNRSPWPGADKRITKKRPRSVLDKVEPVKVPQITKVKPREVVPKKISPISAVPKPEPKSVKKKVVPKKKVVKKKVIPEKKTVDLKRQLEEQRAKRLDAERQLKKIKDETRETEKKLKESTAKAKAKEKEVADLKRQIKAEKAKTTKIDKQLKAQDIVHDKELRRLGRTGFVE